MIADRPSHTDDVEVVDLDAMTVEQLIAERAECWREIQHIEAQLGDPTAIYRLGADEYVLWRKRAVWALRHRKIELHDIANALQERRHADALARHEQSQEKARESDEQCRLTVLMDPTRRIKGMSMGESDLFRQRLRAEQHRRLVVEALRGQGGADGLLIRLAVVLHRLQGGDGLPSDFPEACRQTLRDFEHYLKDLVGKGALRAARLGTLTAATAIEGGEHVAP